MQLQDLHVFVTVAQERSFSLAARKLHRTQPAVSQAIRRIEDELEDRLFDRSSRNGALTEAGTLLLEHAERLLRMASAAQAAVRELQHVRRGRVVIGANEAAVHSLLPFVRDYAASHPQVTVEVRRVPSRRIASELLERSMDFGVMTFLPADRALQSIPLGGDELVMLAHPEHPLARRKRVSIEEVGRQVVIAHNDPSPTRERVLRLYERRHAPINIQISLPSLDGIKRAVEMGVGVAVLPRRCALTEIARGDLVAVKVPELGARRTVRFVFRRTGERSHAAGAFLELVRACTRSV
ncbi:MAG TPA: LysR family transcriptional regulator [Vicinamibacterales bacterium]|jgi:DNA-binding transcriptional LysR family regulator|nr:LysR family transcriptional regulator [Vicinamibacterales bacterium]